VAAKVYAASSRLHPDVKEHALALADATLHSEPEHLVHAREGGAREGGLLSFFRCGLSPDRGAQQLGGMTHTATHHTVITPAQAELQHKRHAQLQLEHARSEPGASLAQLLRSAALRPFVAAGMHVAALKVVCSRENTLPKLRSKGNVIRNKLRCQHQDVRAHEPWMEVVSE
jgi:hypothetical protein